MWNCYPTNGMPPDLTRPIEMEAIRLELPSAHTDLQKAAKHRVTEFWVIQYLTRWLFHFECNMWFVAYVTSVQSYNFCILYQIICNSEVFLWTIVYYFRVMLQHLESWRKIVWFEQRSNENSRHNPPGRLGASHLVEHTAVWLNFFTVCARLKCSWKYSKNHDSFSCQCAERISFPLVGFVCFCGCYCYYWLAVRLMSLSDVRLCEQ